MLIFNQTVDINNQWIYPQIEINMKKHKSKPKTRWHRLLGRMFKELLVPAGITVLTDVPVMSEPPEADILLLKKEQSRWTKEQKERP